MSDKYPYKFTLDDGIQVVVDRTGEGVYAFTLLGKEGEKSRFTYDEEIKKDENWEETLDFDQLNAVRRFWLEQEGF